MDFPSFLKVERIILAVALALGAFFARYVYDLGLLKVFVDQNTHLNISRQVIDSMTPGITQFGFWPPLLHIILIPFVSIDNLYRTGMAGAFTLIPFLALAAFFLYKLLFIFTENKLTSLLGTMLFLLNPYVLYYAVTPMSEVLFVASLFGVAYFLAQWLKTGRLSYFLGIAMLVAFSSISRFEGLILIPLVGLIALVHLIAKGKKYHEIEALVILFLFIAVLGFAIILLYGWIYGNDPLAFMNSNWSAYNQQRDFFLPTEHDAFKSFQYLIQASNYMFGKAQIAVALFCFTIILIVYRRANVALVSLTLLSPFLFDWYSLFRGNTIIYVPELPPYNLFFNERYGLYWIGFIIFTPVIFINFIRHGLKGDKSLLMKALPNFLLLLLIFINLSYLYQVAYVEKFRVAKLSAQGYPASDQLAVARKISEEYDFGKIFITRALHDYVTVNSNVPMKDYIQESNYHFFDQTLEAPWFFARWVVMYNPSSSNITEWGKKNEKISVKWGDSKIFQNYYELVLENQNERLYKIKESVVRKYAKDYNYDLSAIPSLNPDMTTWDPETVYRKIKGEDVEKADQ